MSYQGAVCKGSWALGSACGKCKRCIETKPSEPQPAADINPAMLTTAENATILALAGAWNAYLALPVEHPDERTEFRHFIHAAMNSVAARPVFRVLNREG